MHTQMVASLIPILVAATALPPIDLPVACTILAPQGQPVADRAWIEAQIALANAIFEPYRIGFRLVEVRTLDAALSGNGLIEDRKDRDRLGSLIRSGMINVFVVGFLRDVDEADRKRRGVHWRTRKDPRRHYVIIAKYAHPGVLAHELGHFLGHPRHRDTPGNLMSYKWVAALPVLDEGQAEGMRIQARRFQTSR